MDYAGLGKRNHYAVKCPLTEAERAARYDQKKSNNADPMDFLSVIKLNSHYIDLVDRWYPIRGFWAWLSIITGSLSLIGAGALIYAVVFPCNGLNQLTKSVEVAAQEQASSTENALQRF